MTYIHLIDYSDVNIRMILPPRSDGVAPVVYTYTIGGLNYPTGTTFDGRHIHVLDFYRKIRMILPPRLDGVAPVVHTYSVRGLNNLQGSTFARGYLHLLDSQDNNVRMILPPTSNGLIDAVHTYTVGGLTYPTGAAFDGKYIHLISNSASVRMILPPTEDGIAPVFHTYTVSGLNHPTGIAFDGRHIHLLDNSDDNVRMILPPTVDDVAPVVYTYTVGGLNNLTGATFDGEIPLSFRSETIADQIWSVGTDATITLPEATGGSGNITYRLSSTLPAGLTFVAGTREISGTPTGRFASAEFTYTATNGSETVSLTFTVVVTAPAIAFDSNIANQSWVVGTDVAVTLPIARGGVGRLTYSLSPATPTGVTFVAVTRRVSGNPTGRFASTTFIYTATDSEGVTHTQTFTVVVAPIPPDAVLAITTPNTVVTPGGTVTVTFTYDKVVTDFVAGDVTVTDGVIVSFSGTGTTYIAQVKIPTGSGSLTISVAEDVVTQGNNSESLTLTYTSPEPTPAITSPLSATIEGGASMNIDIAGSIANEDEITPIFGIRRWSMFGDGTLRIRNTPILPEDQDFRFSFKVKGKHGTIVARFKLTVKSSPLAILNHMVLARSPLSYEPGRMTITGGTTKVTELSDNSYQTYSTEKRLTIDMRENGNASRINYIYLKCKNVDSYSFDPASGTGFTNRVIPETVKTVEGRTVKTTFDGYQHDLVVLDPAVTTSSVNLAFAGTNTEIYALAILESGFTIDANSRFSRIVRGTVDRTGGLHEEQSGGLSRYAPLGNERHKRTCDYSLVFEGGEQYDEFLEWVEENANCFHVEEFNRYPNGGYSAYFADTEFAAEYISRYKEVGNILAFRIEES